MDIGYSYTYVADLENIALNRPSQLSTVHNSERGPAEHINDGDPDTDWNAL